MILEVFHADGWWRSLRKVSWLLRKSRAPKVVKRLAKLVNHLEGRQDVRCRFSCPSCKVNISIKIEVEAWNHMQMR